MNLTAGQRALLEEERAWRELRDAARPTTGASGVGMTALIELGFEIWSKTHGWAGVDDEGNQLEPRGGIVIAIADRPDGDGEIHRGYTCLDRTRPPHQQFSHLDEPDVNRDTISLPNAAYQRAAIRRLAQELADDRRTLDFDAEGRCGLIHVLRGLIDA